MHPKDDFCCDGLMVLYSINRDDLRRPISKEARRMSVHVDSSFWSKYKQAGQRVTDEVRTAVALILRSFKSTEP